MELFQDGGKLLVDKAYKRGNKRKLCFIRRGETQTRGRGKRAKKDKHYAKRRYVFFLDSRRR